MFAVVFLERIHEHVYKCIKLNWLNTLLSTASIIMLLLIILSPSLFHMNTDCLREVILLNSWLSCVCHFTFSSFFSFFFCVCVWLQKQIMAFMTKIPCCKHQTVLIFCAVLWGSMKFSVVSHGSVQKCNVPCSFIVKGTPTPIPNP